MTQEQSRTLHSESDVRRYNNGYDRGLVESGSYHPYFMFDHIWAAGYKDAQRDFRPGK